MPTGDWWTFQFDSISTLGEIKVFGFWGELTLNKGRLQNYSNEDSKYAPSEKTSSE